MPPATLDAPAAAPTQYANDVFVNYADDDQEWCVEELILPLKGAGVKVMHKDDYRLAQTTGHAEDSAIKDSRYYLVFLTEAWVKSPRAGFIVDRMQLDPAFRLIPVRAEECEPDPRIQSLVPLDMTDPAKWAAGLCKITELVLGRPADAVVIARGFRALSRLVFRFRVVRNAVARHQLLFDPAARRIEVINDFKRIHDDFQQVEETFKRAYDVLPSPVTTPPAPGVAPDLGENLEAAVETLAAQLDTLLDTSRKTRFPDYEIDWAAKVERIRNEFREVLQLERADGLSFSLRRLQVILGSEPVQINSRIVDGVRGLRLVEVADSLRAVRDALAGYTLAPDAQEWYIEFNKAVGVLYQMAREFEALVANHHWFQGIDETLRSLGRDRRPAPDFVADLWVDVVGPVSQLDPSAGDRVAGLQALAGQVDAAVCPPPTDPLQVRNLHHLFNAFRTELDTAFNRADVDLFDLCSELRTVGQQLRSLLARIQDG